MRQIENRVNECEDVTSKGPRLILPSQLGGVADDGVGGLRHVEIDLHPAAEGEGGEVGLQPQVVLDRPDGLEQPGERLLRHRHLGKEL